MNNIVTADPSIAFPFLSDWRTGFDLAIARSLDRAFGAEVEGPRGLGGQHQLPLIATFLSGRQGVTPSIDLQELVDHDPLAVDLACGLQLWRRPHRVYTAIVRSSGAGSRGPTSERATVISPDSETMVRATEAIGEALELASNVAPGFFADLLAFTEAISLFDEHAAFRGASGLVHLGLSFFSPGEDWDRVIWAEELLHEGTHNMLDAIDAQRPLLQGEDVMDERFDAPLRPDKRPLYGNFHAVVVLARLVRFLDEAVDQLTAVERRRAAERQSNYMRVGTPAFRSVVSEIGSITDFGCAVLAGAAGAVFDAP